MMVVREFEFYEAEGMTLAIPCDMEGGTEGRGLDDAVHMAAEWLKLSAEDALMRGVGLPGGAVGNKPEHGGRIIAVAIDADLSRVPAVNAAEAAARLGVSSARVAQLCRSGLLESWKVGSTRMVSLESIAARLKDRPGAGRPRRADATAPVRTG